MKSELLKKALMSYQDGGKTKKKGDDKLIQKQQTAPPKEVVELEEGFKPKLDASGKQMKDAKGNLLYSKMDVTFPESEFQPKKNTTPKTTGSTKSTGHTYKKKSSNVTPGKQTEELVYLTPPPTTPPPSPFEIATGWSGEKKEKFEQQGLPTVMVGGKPVRMQYYEVPGSPDPKTGLWNTSTGWNQPTKIYGYESAGKFIPVDLDRSKNPSISGAKGMSYDVNDLVPYSWQANALKAYEKGAPRAEGWTFEGDAYKKRAQEQLQKTMEDPNAQIKVTETVSPTNMERSGYGIGKEQEKSKVSGEFVPTERLNQPNKLEELKVKFAKGGITKKYAWGGTPTVNPQLMQGVKSLYQIAKDDTQYDPNSVTGAGIKFDKEISASAGGLKDASKSGISAKFTTPQAGQAYGAIGEIGGAGVDYFDRKDGRSSIAGQTGAGMLRGAGKGAQIGAAFGPQAMVAGAIIGGIGGGIKGGMTGVEEKGERRDAATQDIASSVDQQQYGIDKKGYKSDLYNEKDFKKGLKGLFAKGGTIKGKGTGTSDSIKTTMDKEGIEENSFIVPAKNNGLAKLIRRDVLGDNPNKEAKFKKGGKADMAVSNGEHLFTPKEREKIISYLGKEILEELAPEAEESEDKKYGGLAMKYAKGGLTAAKAKQILRDGTAQGRPLTDKQKGYFGAIAGGNAYGDGGKVKKGNWVKEKNGWVLYGEDGLTVLKTSPTDPTKKASTSGVKSIAKKTPEVKETFEVMQPIQAKLPTTVVADIKTPTYSLDQIANDKGIDMKDVEKMNPNYNPAEQKAKFGLEDAIGFGASMAQTGLGLQQLMKDKRPIDTLDPAFSKLTDEAIAASRYGYTPEQKALLNQQITQGRIAQQAQINQLAGGNAAVGLANSRAAINKEVMNRLQLASEDERLRLQKAQQAAGLAGTRAGMSRQLFNDKMAQFMQNQEAGAALLGAGIQNIVGAARYRNEKLAQQQINKMMYGTPNLPV